MFEFPVRVLAVFGVFAALAAPAKAQFRTELVTGWGDDDTRMVRLGLTRDWPQAWFTDGNWQLGGYWLAQVGYWDSDKNNADNDSLWELGLTPVFRLAPKGGEVRPYLEAGIGGHVLSDTRIGGRQLATAWQFGSHIGTGITCGQFEIGYRFEHLSNASIKEPNDGIDFHMVSAGYRF